MHMAAYLNTFSRPEKKLNDKTIDTVIFLCYDNHVLMNSRQMIIQNTDLVAWLSW